MVPTLSLFPEIYPGVFQPKFPLSLPVYPHAVVSTPVRSYFVHVGIPKESHSFMMPVIISSNILSPLSGFRGFTIHLIS